MSLRELTEFIVKSIVSDTDAVSVFENHTDKRVAITISVSERDMGGLIGRNGKVIDSIKTVVQEASALQDEKFVKINISR